MPQSWKCSRLVGWDFEQCGLAYLSRAERVELDDLYSFFQHKQFYSSMKNAVLHQQD